MTTNIQLQEELDYLATLPNVRRVTVIEMGELFAALGYKLDRSMDCRGYSRYMTGDRAGASYPCTTTSVKESDTGMNAFHVDARRDDRFEQMQELRSEIYAVSRGTILSV